ncbi:MAG: M56 family metallopeptidase, partial [Clostridia bacterium]|nr:M56 family metallopeptidase [Clostridia bacterium]
MFSFVLSLLVLTAMFTLISGAAFLLRKTLLAGREGMMYPFWVIILLIAIVPLKLNIPVPMPEVPDLPPAEPSAELVYTGDFSEIDRIGELYAVPPVSGAAVHSEETRLAADLRRTLVHIGRYADTIAIVAFILWMSGALFHFIGSMTSYVNTRRLMRLNSVSCHDARLVRLLGECRAAVGLRREVELRLFAVDSLCSPCVCGIVHPTLYLEPGCLKLDDRALSCVLIHELTHIRRFDIAIKLFCLFAAAVHWLNPTSRKVQQALFEDCELACDYSVVRIYGNKISGPYMSTILDFVERFSEGSRLVGQSGTGSGLFISEATGAAFLKRRYANMKNYRKDRLATVITGAFTAVCAAANILALSSCSGITPGALSGAIDLTPPVEQMVRAHYGLSADDFITPEMVDGITSLKVEVNEQYANHILVDFTVNGN